MVKKTNNMFDVVLLKRRVLVAFCSCLLLASSKSGANQAGNQNSRNTREDVQALLSRQDHAGALKLLRSTLMHDPLDANALFLAGSTSLMLPSTGRNSEVLDAVRYLTSFLKLHPDTPSGWTNLGLAHGTLQESFFKRITVAESTKRRKAAKLGAKHLLKHALKARECLGKVGEGENENAMCSTTMTLICPLTARRMLWILRLLLLGLIWQSTFYEQAQLLPVPLPAIKSSGRAKAGRQNNVAVTIQKQITQNRWHWYANLLYLQDCLAVMVIGQSYPLQLLMYGVTGANIRIRILTRAHTGRGPPPRIAQTVARSASSCGALPRRVSLDL